MTPTLSQDATGASSSGSNHLPLEPDKRHISDRYSLILDQYETLEQVQQALREAGLESSNLILGIDFTKSNEWSGKHSFQGRSLHKTGEIPNPYQQAIKIIALTLSAFDEDNLIPCFGFGDATTHDHDVFTFYDDKSPCKGFEQALERYRQLVPVVKLAGPTSFAPIIDAAVETIKQSQGQYHVLLIIADGQVTRSVDTEPGDFSTQEQATIDAIVAASDYPLSIILVGVGDGPWDMMKQFDDNIPERAFDNFQFVNFSEIMGRNMSTEEREARFALEALMEIPSQYKATMELKLSRMKRRSGQENTKNFLPPPSAELQAVSAPGGNQEFGKVSAGRGKVARAPSSRPSHHSPSPDSDGPIEPLPQYSGHGALQAPYWPQYSLGPTNREYVYGHEGARTVGRFTSEWEGLERQNAALIHIVRHMDRKLSELKRDQSRRFSELFISSNGIQAGIVRVEGSTEEILQEQRSLRAQIRNFEIFSVEEQDSSFPRFAYVTEKGRGERKWWIELTKVTKERLGLRFLCERSFRTGEFYEVMDQEGIDVSTMKEWAEVLLPRLVWTLKAAYVASKIASNIVLPGLGILLGVDTEVSKIFDKIFPMTQGTAELSGRLFEGIDAYVINRALHSDGRRMAVDEGSSRSSIRSSSWVPNTEKQLGGDAKQAVHDLLYNMKETERNRQVGLRRVWLEGADGSRHVHWICKDCCRHDRHRPHNFGDLPLRRALRS